MITYAEALAAITGLTLPALATGQLPLGQAAGRILADDYCMQRDQPPFDRSTMDGYAVALSDSNCYTVIGTVHAGEQAARIPQAGEAVRIMTGAPVPRGTTVVPIEGTDGGTEQVTVTDNTMLQPGRNIAWQGEDARAGDRILAAGTRLSPVTLAAAAMAGLTELNCYHAPRITILTSGDEVGKAGDAGIADSNGPLLTALLAELGITPTHQHIGDDHGATRSALEAALEHSDIVISTGGVSMGSKDHLPAASTELGGERIFHKVAIQPGKPVLLDRHGQACFLGLPGNPVSVLATAHLFLLPLLGQLWPGFSVNWMELPAANAGDQRKPRQLFLPARLTSRGLEPVAWTGSGDLLAAAHGHGLVNLGTQSSWAAGDALPFLPYIGGGFTSGLLPDRRRS